MIPLIYDFKNRKVFFIIVPICTTCYKNDIEKYKHAYLSTFLLNINKKNKYFELFKGIKLIQVKDNSSFQFLSVEILYYTLTLKTPKIDKRKLFQIKINCI